MGSDGPSSTTALDAPTKTRLMRHAAATRPLWMVARGSSMGRTIPTGASVLVGECTRPRRGQVWAYYDATGALVVHRYRRRTDAGHVLQGDTRPRPDPPVPDERLVGRVTAVRRRGRVRAVGWTDRAVGACQRLPRVLIARARAVARRLLRRSAE
jgi:hypothetical protein